MTLAAIGLFVYGVAAFAVVAPLQLRVVSRAADAPDVASALNISAFTLGSAAGIYLGGWAIDGGLGLNGRAAPPRCTPIASRPALSR